MASITLEFQSEVAVSPEEAWNWITSIEGISTELRPYMRMTTPRGVTNIGDVKIVPGQRLFRSYICLFGFLPVDYSDLTLVEFSEGVGFVEESPMGSMRKWRHERRVEPTANGCTIEDRLSFEPRFAPRLARWLVNRLFTHRHAQLRRHLGGRPANAER